MERTKQQRSKISIYFHFACCFSPFLFYICVSLVAPLFPFPYQAWGKQNHHYVACNEWNCTVHSTHTDVQYSAMQCNTVFYSFNFPCNELSSHIFNENCEQTKVDSFSMAVAVFVHNKTKHLRHRALSIVHCGWKRAKTHGAHGLSSAHQPTK